MSAGGWGGDVRAGVLWSNASFIAARAVNLVALLILARLLAPSEFGVVAAIALYISVIELLSDLGMRSTVVYEQEHGFTDRLHSAFTLNMVLAVLMTGLGVLLAPLVAGFFRVEDHVDLFRLAALNPLLRSLGNIHDALLMREMAFRRRTVPEVAMVLARACVSIPLAVGGAGASSLVIGLLAGSAVWSVVLWLMTGFRPRLTLDGRIARSMVSYGGGAVTLDVISAIGGRIDIAVIGRVLGERALGLYTIAFRIPELLIQSVSWNMSRVAFPALSRKRVADEEGLAAATQRIVHFQALYAVPLAAGIAVLAPPLTVVLFGSQWEAAGGVASAVAVMSGLTAVAFPLGDVFKAIGRQRLLVLLNVIELPLITILIIVVAPAGILAVAWARAAEGALHATLVVLVATRVINSEVSAFLRAVGPACAAGVGVVLGAGAVRIAWPELSAGPLLAGIVAGAGGGLLTLRLLAPAALEEVRRQVAALRAGRRGGASSELVRSGRPPA